MEKNQSAIEQAHIQVERIADELRRQQGFLLTDCGHTYAMFPVEFATDATLALLRGLSGDGLQLLITGARAKSLGHGQKNGMPARIDAQALSLPALMALADPLLPVPDPMPALTAASEWQRLALDVSKQAAVLPALLVAELPAHSDAATLLPGWLPVTMEDVLRYQHTPLLDILPGITARLPIEMTLATTTLTGFRARYGSSVHLALVIGDLGKTDAPLVRVHSSCVTGDLLGSLRCDCGGQLKLALELLAEEGTGVLLYLHQEGRGIGILNKLRAYRLQEQGVDTYDANLLLGYDEDERDFAIAAALLQKLGLRHIRLLTNNPAKLDALEQDGIVITQRVPLVAQSGSHNHAYIQAKIHKSGHLF